MGLVRASAYSEERRELVNTPAHHWGAPQSPQGGAPTLVFVGDVVLSFGVDEQGGQQQRLVQLILQVDVVEACKDGTRADMEARNSARQGRKGAQTRGSYTPGRMADTGRMRCPINLPFSSMTAIRSEASVGRTTCEGTAGNSQSDGGGGGGQPERKVARAYLGENKHLIVPNRVQRVPIGRPGSVLPLCVRRQSKYVHLHVHAHFLVRQELARDHLVGDWSRISGARRWGETTPRGAPGLL